MKDKIFISIAAYRDPELLPTIENCINNSDNPDNLVFVIAWQHCKDDNWDNLNKYKRDKRFKIIDINYKDSKGVCWARNLIQEKYNGEKYYLQLDSHHRFVKSWDSKLKDMLAYLQSMGHIKPVLSAYLPSYFPDIDPKGRLDEVWMLNIDRFLPEGAVFLRPQGLNDWRVVKEPVKARFLSAHFIFTFGSFVKDVPYDPELYFHGEETSLAVRAFTAGYDLFNPHRIYAWHEYTREGKKKHWDDSTEWSEQDKNSYGRFRKLFGMEPNENYLDNKEYFGKFWFGNVRTLEEYEKYAGLKFSSRQIHIETLTHQHPPIKADYENGLCNRIKVCIDVWKDVFTETDYENFAVALLDENGNDLYREDMDIHEFQRLMNEIPNDKFIHIWREYDSDKLPHSWRVWPYSISKGWMDNIEQKIKYE
jgi:hypothetical protein